LFSKDILWLAWYVQRSDFVTGIQSLDSEQP
jgi:hypothetical protein